MQHKISSFKYKRARHLIAAPFILSMVMPAVILDVFLEIYQNVAFPLYGISVNKRRNYIRIDRQKLSYLSFWDKLSCMYCGYANGVAAYAVKIAGDTERYWCAIKHRSGGGFIDQPHQKNFLEYGDEEGYKKFLKQNKEEN